MTNADVVHRMFDEVINLGKLDLIDELFDVDFQSETPHGTFDRDGFREYVAGWRAGFPDVHCDVHDLIESGDAVAWGVRAKGTNTGEFMGMPATGRSMDIESLNIGWFEDGRGMRHVMTMDTAAVMTQLGLMPMAREAPASGVGLVMTFEDIGPDEYEAAMAKGNLDLAAPGNREAMNDWPRGLVSHYAGATPTGWCVVDLWQNQAAFDDFLLNRLGPVLARVGIAEPTVTPFDLYNAHIA